jgi:hypothetical protein
MHPPLIAVGVFDLAPDAVHGHDLYRQILAFINPFDREFGARASPHPRFGLFNRCPIGRLLL